MVNVGTKQICFNNTPSSFSQDDTFFPKRVGEKKNGSIERFAGKHNNNDYNSLLASWLGLEPLKRNLCMNSLTNARCINQISGKKNI